MFGRRRKGKEGEELTLPEWEEDKKEEEKGRVCFVLWKGMEKEGESTYGKARELLQDFPNWKVARLLPDPDLEEKKATITEMQEWTVVVFPSGQGHWRRVHHSINRRVRRIGLDTICAVRNALLRKPTDKEQFEPAPQ